MEWGDRQTVVRALDIGTDYGRNQRTFTGVIEMQISEAEAMVMEVLWKQSPMAADEVVAALSVSTDWAEPTVKTLLNRLLSKGAIAEGRRGLAPARVGELVYEALVHPRPKTRYVITPTRLRQFLTSVLPARTMDRLVAKRLGWR